jgi:DNA-binding PadR family transcriptional regulator
VTMDELDPLIHVPARLQIVATLAALPAGDELSVGRLRDMTGLPPGRLITCLGELEHAGYVRTGRAGGDGTPATAALTRAGRAALARYAAVLRRQSELPGEARQAGEAREAREARQARETRQAREARQARQARGVRQAPAPGVRVGDADRDAAAAALAEHFAQGRLTLGELSTRLEATLTATTHGELSEAARDLPDLVSQPENPAFSRPESPDLVSWPENPVLSRPENPALGWPEGRARAGVPPAAGSAARAFRLGRRPARAGRARPRLRPRG